MSQRPIPSLSFSASARRAGVANEVLERAVGRAELTRVRHGAYADPAAWSAARPEQRHLALVAAAQAAAIRDPVFSHESAAVLLGIPLVEGWPTRPHATSTVSGARRSTGAVVWHNIPLVDTDVAVVGHFRATSPLRTVLDLLATRSFLDGVVAMDHVLARPGLYGVRAEDVIERIERQRPFRNSERSRAVGRFASGLSQSPLESLSMVRFWEGGYALPSQQKRFVIDDETFYTDFYFDETDAVGEADGREKYRDVGMRQGRSADEVYFAEKAREDAVRSRVSAFVRWNWQDALGAAPLYRKLERAGIHPVRTRRSSLAPKRPRVERTQFPQVNAR